MAELGRDDLEPARVVRADAGRYTIITQDEELRAQLTGRLMFQTESPADLPTVGDWVAIDAMHRIVHVLGRRTVLVRKVAGSRTVGQTIAANVDRLLIVNGLDGDFNLSRIERYLVLAHQAACEPVIVLNKADLCDAPELAAEQVCAIAPGVPVLVVSAETGRGWEALEAALPPRQTSVFAGSSGVGKTSLLNRLMGENERTTNDVREGDDRGRHTTTYRELVVLPSGALLVDTPGMRQLSAWAEDDDAPPGFDDVEGFASACRFRDCRHEGEPGCAVMQAIGHGDLDGRRFANWQKQLREAEQLRARQQSLSKRSDRKNTATMRAAQRGARKRKGGEP
jgi:ribosome biogenesis GTPase / thiamine phosphate phosphatase